MSKEQQLVKHLIQSQAFSNVETFIFTSHRVLGDDLKSVLMEKDGRGRPLWFELFAGKPPKSEEDMLSILARMRGGIKVLGDIGVDLLGDSKPPYWSQLFQKESDSFFAIDHINLIYCIRLDEFLRTEFFSFLPEDSIKQTFEQSEELWPLLYERRLTHSIKWIAKIAGINPEASQKVVEIIDQSGSFMEELTHIYNSSNNSRPISPYRQIREFLDLRYRTDKEIKKNCLLFESGKGLLSHEEKREILKGSFGLRSMTLAQVVAKDLGCDLETKEGFAKILPLVEKVGNRTLLNRAFKFKLLDQEINSDFGQTHGVLFFSKAAKSLGSVYSYRGKKEVNIYGEDWLSKVLGKRELFDFLTAKDSQGNYLLHRERPHGGVIELLLSATLPGDTPRGPNRF